jgi:hypothetical protein
VAIRAEDALMKSHNFEFLRRKHPELADLGGFAEAYARSDPGSALVKLRLFLENVVAAIYEASHLPRPYTDSVFDLLNETPFRAAVPEVVLAKLHPKGGQQGGPPWTSRGAACPPSHKGRLRRWAVGLPKG